MRAPTPGCSRSAGTTALTCMLLLPLLALVAFAVDLNYIWRADAELQNAADAAAQAGASALLAYTVQAVPPGQQSVRTAAQTAVATRAMATGQLLRAGDVDLVVNSKDVELGYIADPASSTQTSTGAFSTDTAGPFPNSVRVTVRRDSNVGTGPLRLFFGPVLGIPTSNRMATAVVTLRGQNVGGFNGTGSRLLPLMMSLESYEWLLGVRSAPGGVLKDTHTVRLRIDGGAVPPANVQPGADGVKELQIYPDVNDPADYGLLSLTNRRVTSSGTYTQWIRQGPSAADLQSFGAKGLQATESSPATMYAGPKMRKGLITELQGVIGQPRIIAIAGPPATSGTVTHPVMGFVGATLVAVDTKSLAVSVQLCPVLDPTVTLAGGPEAGLSRFIYRGLSLTR